MTDDPHARRPVARGGAPLSRAKLAMILVHGRGGGAQEQRLEGNPEGCDDAVSTGHVNLLLPPRRPETDGDVPSVGRSCHGKAGGAAEL